MINEGPKNKCGCEETRATYSALQQVTPVACSQFVTTELCSQATVTLEPIVTPGTPIVSCINAPIIGTCEDIPGFTPLSNAGLCSFTVSQVICVNVPLAFSVDVSAIPSGGACGPVVSGDRCPSLI